MDTQNSFSTIIKQFTQMNANTLETFDRINKAITSSDDALTVSVDLFGTPDDDGNTTIKTYQIPSFGFLDREIKRLENNLKALSGVGTADTTIKLSDGSFKRLITKKLKTPANDLTSLPMPTTFETTDNDFFEDFLNPLLTVKFDVSGQIASDTERVLVKRIIFPSNDDFAKSYFEDNYLNADQLDYNNVLKSIVVDSVNVTIDEQIRDLPFKAIQYYGGFDVTGVENVEKTFVVDGEDKVKVVKLYTVNKLTYNNSQRELKETEVLAVGDQLMVNSGNNSTRFEIENIYAGTGQLQLKLIEGFDVIQVGADQLKIYKALEDQVSLSINVGFDERQIVFFKSIDPSSKIIAENWSPGVGFFSNNLEITRPSGETENLSSFYKNSVADFGQFIKSLKDDFIPPITVGIKPPPPEISADNFKVVQINNHLTDNDAFENIKNLSNDKINVLESIKKLDETIVSKRSEIATKKYTSDVQKNTDKNNLASLVEKRSSEAKLYSSIVNQIKSINSDQNITEIKPKFRVRGFWKVPAPIDSEDTLPQEIIKFKLQYRYVSVTGKASNVEQIPVEFKEGGKKKKTTASFSNWVGLETPTRERKQDPITGKYYWVTESIEDGQSINFNQLDLPINLGENVEIRLKAISEAGYPANAMESEWSDPIKINFPDGLLNTSNVISLVEENAKETTYVQLVDELDSKGLYTHISDSFIANEKYYSHGSTNIASGFLTEEQTPISLFDKLISLQQTIEALKEQIENAEGELLVTVVDDEGKTIEIQKNTTNSIFAGYYTDEVADLNIKKGHIVTKTYKLLLENTKATELELVARMVGNREEAVYPSSSTGAEVLHQLGTHDYTTGSNINLAPRIENDTYYTVEGKYDLVPIQYQNMSEDENQLFTFNSFSPYQSAQRKGQWIYSRYMDVAGEKPLYGNAPPLYLSQIYFNPNATPPVELGADGFEWQGSFPTGLTAGNTNTDFIWDGNTITPGVVATGDVPTVNGGYDNLLMYHIDHPIIQEYIASGSTAGVNVNEARMPKWSSLFSQNINGELQTAYGYDENALNPYADPPLTGRGFKMSFEENDQYLLGGRSVGAFLFLNPVSIGSLVVDGDNKFGRKRIGPLDTKQVNSKVPKSPNLSVDIVFQYRMTDYFGVKATGAVDSFPGRVAGRNNNQISNLTYSKKIGLDIFDSNDNQFSFDLRVFAKYKPIGLNLNNTGKVQLTQST